MLLVIGMQYNRIKGSIHFNAWSLRFRRKGMKVFDLYSILSY